MDWMAALKIELRVGRISIATNNIADKMPKGERVIEVDLRMCSQKIK